MRCVQFLVFFVKFFAHYCLIVVSVHLSVFVNVLGLQLLKDFLSLFVFVRAGALIQVLNQHDLAPFGLLIFLAYVKKMILSRLNLTLALDIVS